MYEHTRLRGWLGTRRRGASCRVAFEVHWILRDQRRYRGPSKTSVAWLNTRVRAIGFEASIATALHNRCESSCFGFASTLWNHESLFCRFQDQNKECLSCLWNEWVRNVFTVGQERTCFAPWPFRFAEFLLVKRYIGECRYQMSFFNKLSIQYFAICHLHRQTFPVVFFGFLRICLII